MTITQTLTYAATHSGIYWEMLLPAGWSYASGGSSEGDLRPVPGKTSLLEWSWTTAPASPVTFTVTLNVPANQTGDQAIVSLAIFRVAAGEAGILVTPDPLIVPQVSTHSGDTDRNFQLSLPELTRIIGIIGG